MNPKVKVKTHPRDISGYHIQFFEISVLLFNNVEKPNIRELFSPYGGLYSLAFRIVLGLEIIRFLYFSSLKINLLTVKYFSAHAANYKF